jgi:molybdopterin-biosynthesis enzyme MoeA-like protein
MTCGTFTVTDVPESDLQETIDLWQLSTPTPTITSTAQTAGVYTVVVTFPPCPANTTHDPNPQP